MLHNENLSNLLELCHYINDEANRFIPYSSNIPSVTNQPAHRSFWLRAMRAPTDSQKTRKTILANIQVNLSKPDVETNFKEIQLKELKKQLPKGINTVGGLSNYFHELKKTTPAKKQHKDGSSFTVLNGIESKAKRAVQFGIGNCDEKGSVAFVLLIQYPQTHADIRVELVNVYGEPDHCYLLINRDPSTIHTDMSSWNSDTIILDPWMKETLVIGDKEKLEQSAWYAWAKKYEKDMTNTKVTNGFIGRGYSTHWIAQRNKKNQPLNLRDWQPYRNLFSLAETAEQKENREDQVTGNVTPRCP